MEDYYYSSSSEPYGSYSYTTTSFDSSDAAVAVFMATFGLIFFLIATIIFIAFYVYMGITLGKIFKKTGQPSWPAWVPFYNMWKMLELGGFNGALILLSLIPFFGQLAVTVISAIAAYRIGLKFGKSGEFVLLYLFLNPVWFGVLAFGKAEWSDAQVAATANATDSFQPTVQNTQPLQPVQPQTSYQPPMQDFQSTQTIEQPIASEQPVQSEQPESTKQQQE